jgi:hypothetical protein
VRFIVSKFIDEKSVLKEWNNMTNTKLLIGVFAGAFTSGGLLSVSAYFWSLNSPLRGGNFISFDGSEYLLAIMGAIIGAIIGGVSGGVIFRFELSFFKAIIFAFLINLGIWLGLRVITSPGPNDLQDLKDILGALIVVGLINGATLGLMSKFGKQLT